MLIAQPQVFDFSKGNQKGRSKRSKTPKRQLDRAGAKTELPG